MILYHASTVPITEFYIPYGGLHLGGVNSSLEAALRKLRSHLNVSNASVVYLHKCEVQLGRIVCTDDLGGDQDWRDIFSTEYDSVKYINKYEPDVDPSYMIWDASRITVLSTDSIYIDDAEDMVNDFYENYI